MRAVSPLPQITRALAFDAAPGAAASLRRPGFFFWGRAMGEGVIASARMLKTKSAEAWTAAARASTRHDEAKVFAWYAAAAAHDERGIGAVNPFCAETEKDLRAAWWWFFGLRSKAARKEAEQVAKSGPRPAFNHRAPAVRTTSRAYADLMGVGVEEERV